MLFTTLSLQLNSSGKNGKRKTSHVRKMNEQRLWWPMYRRSNSILIRVPCCPFINSSSFASKQFLSSKSDSTSLLLFNLHHGWELLSKSQNSSLTRDCHVWPLLRTSLAEKVQLLVSLTWCIHTVRRFGLRVPERFRKACVALSIVSVNRSICPSSMGLTLSLDMSHVWVFFTFQRLISSSNPFSTHSHGWTWKMKRNLDRKVKRQEKAWLCLFC